MEISLLKELLENISSFLQLSSFDNIKLDIVQKYYKQAEEILKLLKPIFDAIVDSDVASNEVLNKAFKVFGQSIDELTELIVNWQPLLSRVYFVLHVESLMSKIKSSGLDIMLQLKSPHQCLPNELSSTSLELCYQKIKRMEYEQISSIIKVAISNQVDGVAPSSEILVKVAESLSLQSDQEILIEVVALEKLKENAEQAEKAGEAKFMDQMISLATRMHDRLVQIKQSQICSPIPIPSDFCCPLSLEIMTDPVIVASGQTYERSFIKKWIDLGLTVCPKTHQTLAHTTLIPNYTVKALIANWCELNKVKLPDPSEIASLSHLLAPFAHADSSAPRDSHIFPQTRGNQQIMPDSIRSTSLPARNLVSSTTREGSSPLHPRSLSEPSLSGIAEHEAGLDIARISLSSFEDRSSNSGAKSMELVSQPSISPTRKEFSVTIDTLEQSSYIHNQTASASIGLSNTNLLQSDTNETSEVSNHSDAFGEVKFELQAATTRQREVIGHHPSEWFVLRTVSNNSAAGTRADLSGIETKVQKLVEDLKSMSLDTLKEATAELRLLAKHTIDNRMVIANCGAISILVDLLHSNDPEIQENAVTTLLNLSINDNNKNAIVNANAIEPLIQVLQTGSPEARGNSAATLFSLSAFEDNKIKIGRSGAIGPLVDLLRNGTPNGKKDAVTALFNLSIYHENKARIVQAGAIKHLVDLMDPAAGMVDRAVVVLSNLATIPEGRIAIDRENGIPFLVEVVELGSARGKENAAAALLQLCTYSNRLCSMVLQEGAVPPLVALSRSGTPRAKEKAQSLLSYLRNQQHGNAGRG